VSKPWIEVSDNPADWPAAYCDLIFVTDPDVNTNYRQASALRLADGPFRRPLPDVELFRFFAPGGPGNRGRYELALSLKQAGALKDGVRPDELKNVSVRSETLYDAERYARWSAILEVGYSVFRPREEIYLSNYAGRKRAKVRGPIVPVELDRDHFISWFRAEARKAFKSVFTRAENVAYLEDIYKDTENDGDASDEDTNFRAPASIVDYENTLYASELMAQLDPIERQIVELRAMGFRSKQIAELLGMSPGAVDVRLHRLRERLKPLADAM
jgi:RNA polymerase sigma factor (sigma-70 family)